MNNTIGWVIAGLTLPLWGGALAVVIGAGFKIFFACPPLTILILIVAFIVTRQK